MCAFRLQTTQNREYGTLNFNRERERQHPKELLLATYFRAGLFARKARKKVESF